MYLEIDVFGVQSFSFGRVPKAEALDSNNLFFKTLFDPMP
jgi:hypothetical protein